jgi:alpha-beta hydrolase superfamily lysophospholipase
MSGPPGAALARNPAPLIRRQEGYFAAAAGRELFERAWLPEAPRAAALLVHGLAEHSGRYEHVGTWLAARGIAVHAFDHQGHGRSRGVRCYVRRFSELLDDANSALARARDAHPGLPLFVVGHSMGGLVTASLASEPGCDATGFAITGAALVSPAAPSPPLRIALRVLSWILPRLSIDNGLDPNALSTDPDVGRRYVEDPLVPRRITVALAHALFAQMRYVAGRGSRVQRPLLALHGEDDSICSSVGSERFAAAAPHGRYLGFPGMRHEILNEPDRAKVLETLLTWMREVGAL